MIGADPPRIQALSFFEQSGQDETAPSAAASRVIAGSQADITQTCPASPHAQNRRGLLSIKMAHDSVANYSMARDT